MANPVDNILKPASAVDDEDAPRNDQTLGVPIWQGRKFDIEGTPYIGVSDMPDAPGGRWVGDPEAFEQLRAARIPAPGQPGKWLVPESMKPLLQKANYLSPDNAFRDWLTAATAIVGGGLAAGAAGAGAAGAAEGAAGGLAAADTAGLATMAADAGLTGAAADAFVASGGAMGSTAAGGTVALEGFIDPWDFAVNESADAAIGEVASAEGLTTPVSDTLAAAPETGPYNAGAGAFDASGVGVTNADFAATGFTPPGTQSGGIINDILAWGHNNPVLASTAVTVGGGLLKGAFSPSPKEIAQAQANAQAEVAAKNLQNKQAANQLGGVSLSRLKPTGKRLPRPGLINSRM